MGQRTYSKRRGGLYDNRIQIMQLDGTSIGYIYDVDDGSFSFDIELQETQLANQMYYLERFTSALSCFTNRMRGQDGQGNEIFILNTLRFYAQYGTAILVGWTNAANDMDFVMGPVIPQIPPVPTEIDGYLGQLINFKVDGTYRCPHLSYTVRAQTCNTITAVAPLYSGLSDVPEPDLPAAPPAPPAE